MPADAQTLADLARALAAREVSAEETTRRCLDRIAERNPSVNAYITRLEEQALAEARRADAEIRQGQYRGPLHGVPISLKDLIDVRGVPTTAASKVRHGHIASRDARIVERLRAAGAVLLGKTNLHEFAFGTTSEDSAFGPVRHPLDVNRSAGGSSGGSAASVLDGQAYASIGTDTGGSIRIPAAACGLVGLKPSLGDVDVDGIVPLSTTMDHAGPITRSVEDAAIVFDVLRGAPVQTRERGDVRGRRFGVLRGYFTALLDTQVASAFESVLARLADAGAEIEDVELPHAADISPIYLTIVLAEALALHAKMLDSRPEEYTPNTRLRLEMGRYILAQDYVRALRGRQVLTAEVDAALDGRDALLLPSLAIPAPKLGTQAVKLGTVEEPLRGLMLRLTQPFNITGHPAIAVPCGTTVEGLPVSTQLVGPLDGTDALLQIAMAAEPYVGPGASR